MLELFRDGYASVFHGDAGNLPLWLALVKPGP